jgi:hypothetical protein
MTASSSTTPGPRPERWYQRRIDAHFGGRPSPAGERELRAHLPACASCRDYYDRHLELAALDPQRALPTRERLARGLGLAVAARTPPRPLVLSLAAATALGALVLATGLNARPALQARGGDAPGSQLLVYELAPGEAPRPLTAEAQVRGESGLAFAYANIGRKRHLLVFAVDDERRVYWYHPTWSDAQQDPVAIDLAPDAEIHEIPAAITHPLAGRELEIFGVFTDDALSVRQVEALIARAPLDGHGRLVLPLERAEVTRLELRLAGGR